MNSNIINIINKYLCFYKEEEKEIYKLIDFVNNNKDNLFNRKNYNGHITASGYIYAINDNKLLLLDHKSLKKYLQPGGHVETNDKDTLCAAKREIFEETGLIDLKLVNLTDDIIVPFDINSHYIEKNEKKSEDGHFHHDFGYLFKLDSISDVKIDYNESNGYKWVSVELLENDEKFKTIIAKIKRLIK